MAIKLLIGGSPCTRWSIAQKNNRETEAEGLGWELFKNYLITLEKFQPDFFLYENNKSAAQAIKDKIAEELGVGTDPQARFTDINSALVSAQNRQRFYVTNFGDIEQPADRGILLRDILETGENLTGGDKSFCLTASYDGARAWNTIERSQRTMAAEPVAMDTAGTATVSKAIPEIVDKYGYLPEMFNPYNRAEITEKSPTLSTGSMVTSSCATVVVDPMPVTEATAKGYTEIQPGDCVDLGMANSKTRRGRSMKDKANCLTKSNEFYQYCGTVDKPIYEVKDGFITIKGKQYPIKLKDGYYIIRKLTVAECCRLQTMPDDYCKAVSASQGYKGLGNGWTGEIIIHLLQHALKDVPRDEEIIVLSMYDGIGTGRYCLDKMGFTNVKYYAYEIDKYAIKVALANFPDIIQCGRCFRCSRG